MHHRIVKQIQATLHHTVLNPVNSFVTFDTYVFTGL